MTPSERFMRHYYGASGFVEKKKMAKAKYDANVALIRHLQQRLEEFWDENGFDDSKSIQQVQQEFDRFLCKKDHAA